MDEKVKGADWFIKIIDELKNTPEWKDETIDILEGEIKVILVRIKKLEEELDKIRRTQDYFINKPQTD